MSEDAAYAQLYAKIDEAQRAVKDGSQDPAVLEGQLDECEALMLNLRKLKDDDQPEFRDKLRQSRLLLSERTGDVHPSDPKQWTVNLALTVLHRSVSMSNTRIRSAGMIPSALSIDTIDNGAPAESSGAAFSTPLLAYRQAPTDRQAPANMTECAAPNRLTDMFSVDKYLLSPQWDYDFTSIDPANESPHQRGGREYKRPCGWKRFALDVDHFDLASCKGHELKVIMSALGVAGSNLKEKPEIIAAIEQAYKSGSHGQDPPQKWWLEEDGNPAEWAVAYHGTTQEAVGPIADEGLQAGWNNVWGVGIYCTPNVATAAVYADPVEIATDIGSKYMQVVFQCRVRGPEQPTYEDARIQGYHEIGINNPDSYANDYWVVPRAENVRPYGILLRHCDEFGGAL